MYTATSTFNPVRSLVSGAGSLFFYVILVSYSSVALVSQLTLFVLSKGVKLSLVILFYGILAVFGLALSVLMIGYMLLTLGNFDVGGLP